ncbi:hypothetical protein BGZ83_000043 [Gryganskiella cystojenkinii]|nr:hypothetical protein BGZ83_000043 [Gryganskiella cystojenkinii]
MPYFHQLRPEPLDLPEIIERIHADLVASDIRSCCQVSKTWYRRFGPFLWDVTYFNRFTMSQQGRRGNVNENAVLQRNGHLIRTLFTYALHDQDLRTIARCCPNLESIQLEIANLTDPKFSDELFKSIPRLKQLVVKVLNTHGRSPVLLALLDPIACGDLSKLTELRLVGVDSFQSVPAYQSGMILRCLEGCPVLEVLELNTIRIVDTEKQWIDSIENSFSSVSDPHPQSDYRRLLPWSKFSGDRAKAASVSSSINGNNSASPSSLSADPLKSLNTTPTAGFKNQSVKILRLLDLYGNPERVGAFRRALLQCCPNLTELSMRQMPMPLVTECPQLEFLRLENSTHPYPTPALSAFLAQPPFHLRRLGLSRCGQVTDRECTEAVATTLSERGLRVLEISHCVNLSVEGLARFVARCENLERIWVDRLLSGFRSQAQSRWSPRSRHGQQHSFEPQVSPPPTAGTTSAQLPPIDWRCIGIRHLDLYGLLGVMDTFENVLLDLLPKLQELEFLGVRSQHVEWLMKLEPLRSTTGSLIDFMNDSPVELKEEGNVPVPLDMLSSITTLSIDPSDRRGDQYYSPKALVTLEQAKYLYYACPRLEKIIYHGNDFPCTREAWDWLLRKPSADKIMNPSQEQQHLGNQGPDMAIPRIIQVEYRSREEADAALWSL